MQWMLEAAAGELSSPTIVSATSICYAYLRRQVLLAARYWRSCWQPGTDAAFGPPGVVWRGAMSLWTRLGRGESSSSGVGGQRGARAHVPTKYVG
eukprot:1367949-Rhodomonas_salina.2